MSGPRNLNRLTLGVCGGIAAYRAVELVRALQQAGFDPHVAMTAAAEQFVTPLTFAAISGHRVLTSLWTGPEVPESGSSSIEHIDEAQSTRALIIVPATADILGKLAHGIADDFLTTLYLATPAPVIIAPAMNVVMWQHPAVQANVATLRARGNILVEPGAGYLACGMTGAGRLADLPAIVAAVERALRPKDLELETVLITAGGTREPIDGVRFLGNRSSGRMGYALAEEALSRGARVILISAPTALTPPPAAEFIPVTTTAEMRDAVLNALPRATLVLKAAAVADFRPASIQPGKLTRAETLTLTLEPTEDIVAKVAARRSPETLVIAFAAEMPPPEPSNDRVPHVSTLRHGISEDILTRAREKLLRKNVDAIVVNDVSIPGLGFDSESNAAVILLRSGESIEIPPTSKLHMAARILDTAVTLRHQSHATSEAAC
jgi:phosphopantothenoylcysteine decarboxylase/phosphopantothenate--cysteine ligase